MENKTQTDNNGNQFEDFADEILTEIDNLIVESHLPDDITSVTEIKPEDNKASAHSDILESILATITKVDFNDIAGLEQEEKLPQKHMVVICINELLKKVKAKNLDLARKDDTIFAFNGVFWKDLSREQIKNLLGLAAQKMSVYELESQHYEFKDKLLKQFLSAAHFELVDARNDEVLINLQNGTFVITKNSQTLREFRSGDFLTYQLPFEYNPEATYPRFQRFLDEVLPEKESQDVLAEFFGYVFTKGLKMEKALLLFGEGANGKSVIFVIINAILGKENISNFSLSNLLEEHNRALLNHKLLNYGSEINATRARDEFKNLVSTEPIQARLKYGNSFTMTNYAKLAFNCNELPKDFDHSNAHFRRLIIILFNVTIDEKRQNKRLAENIIEHELAGVFNWIIDGLKRLLKTEKFTESKIVNETLENYKRDSDSIACFIDENPKIVGSSLKLIYTKYRSYCTAGGFTPLGRGNFSKRLKTHGFILEKQRHGYTVTELNA